MPPSRSASLSSNDSQVRDARVASEDTHTFYQRNILVTGRRVLAKHRRPGQGLYVFETTTKTTELEIDTTETPPAIMMKPKRSEPIHRPAPAGNNGPFERRQVIQSFFPHEKRNNTTAARSRYAPATPTQAGPSRMAAGPSRVTGPSRVAGPSRVPREFEIIAISDDETDDESKNNAPAVVAQQAEDANANVVAADAANVVAADADNSASAAQ
ncbi:hypothetical protein BJ912DRAFT_1058818 [Pholiota molesta]|nr:hypothetical protein BJ912DRAFT_1058818 [Pholiota molesta]